MMRRIVTTCGALGVILAMAVISGCGDKRPESRLKSSASKTDHHDDHAHEGPHGGHIIELGDEEYHAELVHDDKTNTATVYVLDSSAKKAAPIAAEDVTINLTIDGKAQQFKLAAKPLDGEQGKSSRFEASDEALMKALDAEGAKGRLNLTSEGKTYSGEIEHHDHDDHKHESKK
jgi:hypothetical protein